MIKQAIPKKTNQARILVVDDYPDMATSLGEAISRIAPGVEVITATSSELALKKIGDNTVDLLITDMMMPNINGLELVEKLHLRPGGRPVYIILITAYDVPGLRESAKRLNVDEIVIKPFPPEHICRLVEKTLDKLKRSEEAEQLPSKILVVDDEPTNILLLSRYFQNTEFKFITASNGVEALEKTRSEMPDLLLLDLNMPAMDGFDVLREIRRDHAIKHIPVIILTAARSDPLTLQYSLGLGADDFVTKPFDRRDLLARIRTKLRVKKAEDAIRRRNKELSLLPEIGKDLSTHLDIDSLAGVLLYRTVETLGAMFGHISIFNSATPFRKEYYANLSSAPHLEISLSSFENLLELTKGTRQVQIINDTNNDVLWKAIPGIPSHSAIVVPLFGRFELVGLLVLMHEDVGYFNLEQQLLLQTIASQAAIAVENVQLYVNITQEQYRMTAVLESVPDAILIFDAKGCLLLSNTAGEKLFAKHAPKPGLPLVRGCGYDILIELLEETCTGRKPLQQEITWPDERIFTARITPVEAEGCVVNLHDISHLHKVVK